MKSAFQALWGGIFGAIRPTTSRLQMAALCHRRTKKGAEVLLITSRDTGRWIIPKGWPMEGKSPAETALQEAWEEAGVIGTAAQADAIGTYSYDKRFDDGTSTPVETLVFPVEVTRLADTFPEASERNRKWVSPGTAANLVQEPDLQDILRDFDDRN